VRHQATDDRVLLVEHANKGLDALLLIGVERAHVLVEVWAASSASE